MSTNKDIVVVVVVVVRGKGLFNIQKQMRSRTSNKISDLSQIGQRGVENGKEGHGKVAIECQNYRSEGETERSKQQFKRQKRNKIT